MQYKLCHNQLLECTLVLHVNKKGIIKVLKNRYGIFHRVSEKQEYYIDKVFIIKE